MFEPKATASHLDSTKRAVLGFGLPLPVFPTGKSPCARCIDLPVLSSPILKKISDFQNRQISCYIRCRLVPLEGRFAIVTDAGRDAVDADGAPDEDA